MNRYVLTYEGNGATITAESAEWSEARGAMCAAMEEMTRHWDCSLLALWNDVKLTYIVEAIDEDEAIDLAKLMTEAIY